MKNRYLTGHAQNHRETDRVRNAISKHLEEGALCDLEYWIRTKSEGYRWLHGRGQAIWDDQGNRLRMSGSIQDISNQKSVEQQECSCLPRARALITRRGTHLFPRPVPNRIFL